MPDWRAISAVPAFTRFGGSRSIYPVETLVISTAWCGGPWSKARVPSPRSGSPTEIGDAITDRPQGSKLEATEVRARSIRGPCEVVHTCERSVRYSEQRGNRCEGSVTGCQRMGHMCERPGHAVRRERSGSARHRVRECERVGALVWRSSHEVRAPGQQVRATGHDVQPVGAVVKAIGSGSANDPLTHCKRSSQIPLGVRPWLVIRGQTGPMYERSIGAVHHRALIPLCGG